MTPSVAGLAVCVVLLIIGKRLKATVVVALLASLPFASTAFAELPAVGGSTPLVYTLMSILLIATTIRNRNFAGEVRNLFVRHMTAWIVLGLLIYVIASAILLPRIFEGETIAFAVLRNGITEQLLRPVPQNITQTAYFALGCLTFYALAIELAQRNVGFPAVHTAFVAYVLLSISLGAIDLCSKLAGTGDLLLPIRTASYSLLTEATMGSFWRIVGASPEASTFGIGMLSCLAYSTTYWRNTGDRRFAVLSALSLLFCLLSTSTTAYAGLVVLGGIQFLLLGRNWLRRRFTVPDMIIASALPVIIVVLLGVHVADEKALAPLTALVDSTIVNKASSDSGQERSYWNRRSLQTVWDTYGLGVGLGSSRASSWMIAVISQLGVAGALLMALAVISLLIGPPREFARSHGLHALATARGARASALAFLVGGTISGAAAEPGVLFFISLAVCVASRHVDASRISAPELTATGNAGEIHARDERRRAPG